MAQSKLPESVAMYLASLNKQASDIPSSSITVDELRLQIRNALLHGTNILEQMEHQRKHDPLQSFGKDAQSDALHVLQQNMPSEVAKKLVDEIVDKLRYLPPRDDREPYEFWVLALNLQIIRYIARNHFDKTPLPWLDTLGIGHVNANIKTFDNEHILVFQSGTKAFTNLISKAIIGVWGEFSKIAHGRPELTLPENVRNILQGIEATQAFGSIIHAYLFLGQPVGGRLVLLNDQSANAASHLETAMDRFIVGHEYAHILKNHQPDDKMKYRNELEADSIGLSLMLESMQDWGLKDNVFSLCGAYLIVMLHELITKTISRIQGAKLVPASYPPGYHRCINLLATCERKGILTTPMEQIAIAQGYQVSEIYNIIEPMLLKEASKGRKLSPIWA